MTAPRLFSDEDALMLPSEVAEQLRISESTLGTWRHEGKGPAAQKLGRKVVYRKSSVLAWLAGESA